MMELSTNEDSAAVKSDTFFSHQYWHLLALVCGRLYGNISAIVVRGFY
jgi:hypothetical protein